MIDTESKEALTKFFFGCEPEDIAKDVVLVAASRGAWSTLRKQFPSKKEFNSWFEGFTAKKKGKEITVVFVQANPGDCIYFLNLSPCKRVLWLGGISGLAEKMKIGDVIIPNAAEAHDAFTPYFSSSELQKPDQNFSNALATFLKKHMKNRVWRGWIYTSGSLAVQTLPWLKKLRANGFIGLELGISEAFTAGKKFGIKVAAACYITDLGIRKNFLRITKEDNKIRFKIRDTLAKALVEFICRDN